MNWLQFFIFQFEILAGILIKLYQLRKEGKI